MPKADVLNSQRYICILKNVISFFKGIKMDGVKIDFVEALF
jgi:hypothetical protein